MTMKCELCGAGVNAGLFRINPKGETGIWRCIRCLPPDRQPDPLVLEIVQTVRGNQP